MLKTLGVMFATATLLVTSACGGSAGDDTDASSASKKSGQETVEKVAATGDLTEENFVERLSAAQIEAGTAKMEMTSSLMGSEMVVSGVMRLAEKVEDVQSQVSMDMGVMQMDVRLVGGVMYMKMGELSGGKFIKVDLSDPEDPFAQQYGSVTEQMDPAAQLKTFREALVEFENLGDGGEIDGVETTRLRLVLDTKKAIAGQLEGADDATMSQVPEQIEYEMFVGSDDLMRKIEMDFAQMPMTITYSGWGDPVSVEAPAKSEITDASALGGLAGSPKQG